MVTGEPVQISMSARRQMADAVSCVRIRRADFSVDATMGMLCTSTADAAMM